MKKLGLFCSVLLAVFGFGWAAQAAINVAGSLYVDVDATGLPVGSIPYVPNAGTLSGVFDSIGDVQTRVVYVGSVNGINFDTHCRMANKATPGGAYVPVPAGLLGNPTFSVEVWAYNPTIEWEESMVSWGTRGPDCGNNCSFMYSSDAGYGAVGTWCWDLGWNGAPPQAQWHYLVGTYDGTANTLRVYSDGVEKNNSINGDTRNILAGPAIALGAEWNQSLNVDEPALDGSLVPAKVRVHSGVLTDAQIQDNYNQEAGSFYIAGTGAALPSAPVHRYTFNNAPGNAAGQTVPDVGSTGGADAVVQGSPATFNGNKLSLAGGSSATAAYVDLPNGLISSLSANNGGPGKLSVEGWVTPGNEPWSRIFDFGTTTTGELTGPGGDGTGQNYFMLSAQTGGDLNWKRLEVFNTFTYDIKAYTANIPLHFVVTWDEGSGEIIAYFNGEATARVTTSQPISYVNDVNVWLGRSNWTGDSNLQGDFDEFRIYNYVLGPQNVMKNYLNGPDVVELAGAAAVVAATPANPVGASTATLNGVLSSATAPTTVTVYYGTTDGGTDKNAWSSSFVVGSTAVGPFSAAVSGLTPGTLYYYRCYAVNANGEGWSLPVNFTTQMPAVIQNLPAQGITPASAYLRGTLTSISTSPTYVRAYWGETDGGQDTGAWLNAADLSAQTPGVMQAPITGLASGQTYYYRFYAVNADGEGWASSSQSFVTPPIFDPSGYYYSTRFTFGGYTQTEPLLEFPAMIRLGVGIPGFEYGQFLSPGPGDLRFTDSDGGELNYEIDSWDTQGTSVVWVRVPALASSITYITAYWGRAGQTAPDYSLNGSTWNSDYVGVWHMNEAMVKDASLHGYNASSIANPGAVSSTAGMIGTAQNYNSTVGDGTTLVGNVKLVNQTLSGWVWLRNDSYTEKTFMSKNGDPGGTYFYEQGDHLRFETTPWGGDTYVWMADVGVEHWVHVAATSQMDPANPAQSIQTFYLNGVQYGASWTKQTPNPNDNDWQIGGSAGGWRLMNGYLDELRAERTPRSPSWILACCKNQGTPDQFMYNTGATYIGPPQLLVASPTVTGIGTDSATLGATIAQDGGSPVTQYGTVFDTTPDPVANASSTPGPVAVPFVFSEPRTGFTPGTLYYYRGYAVNAVSGTVYSPAHQFYTQPDPASGVGFPAINNISLTISWLPALPSAGSLVVMSLGAPVTAVPTDATTYSANSFPGSGTDLGSGQFAVYAGSDTSVTVNGLFPGATYYVSVFSYAGTGPLLVYQPLFPAEGSATTTITPGDGIVAGTLLINLDVLKGVETNASGLVTSWANNGSVGGSFLPGGDATTQPGLTIAGGLPAITFNGASRLLATFPAPAEITGLKNDYTFEAWAFNPSIADEECLMSWSTRGGPDGSNVAINYGSSAAYGAVGHWGAPDMGWDGPVPAAGLWHYLAEVYDGTTEHIYVDGQPRGSETKDLNIWTGLPVSLGMPYFADTTTHALTSWTTGLGFSGSLNVIRVHSQALTADQVAANYLLGPHYAPSVIEITVNIGVSGDDVTIQFNSAVGLNYRVYYSESLQPIDWQPAGPAQPGTGSTMTVNDQVSAHPSNIVVYKVVTE